MIHLLLLAAFAHAKTPVTTPLSGHRRCVEVPGSFYDCPMDEPASFTYDVTGNRIQLDLENCAARTLRFNYAFGTECVIGSLSPEMGKPDLVHVITKAGCMGYYRCE